MDITNDTKVQRVNKKSSDELLRKFAEMGSDPGDESAAKKDMRLAKRRKRVKSLREFDNCKYGKSSASDGGGSALVERKRLLPPAVSRRQAVPRRLGIGKSQLSAGGIRNRSLMGTLGKTWRRTVEGASRVFMEKHYNKHRRLISDAA